MEPLFELIAAWFADSPLMVVFTTGFLSATLLPGGSEASLLMALSQESASVASLVVATTLGNTLGGLTNYWLGLWLPNRTQHKKSSQTAIRTIQRYGAIALILSWLPVIGDPLCVAAGWLRLRFIPCLIAIVVGKALRYLTLIALYFGMI